MSPVFLLFLVFVHNIGSISVTGNRYPVFWNVEENETPYVDVTKYDILPRNYTQVGDGCSTQNCQSWTQGVFPQISDNGQIINGGVPQNGNLTLHLDTIKQQLPSWIPNVNWTGNAVLDFEAWTTVWDYNDGSGNWHGKRYQNYSIYLAQIENPNITNHQEIVDIAKKSFEEAATNWFVETLNICRSIRPNAFWGFYGLPLNLYEPCTGLNTQMQCGYDNPINGKMYKNYSDQQIPIWKASTAIFPSIYLPPYVGDDDNMYHYSAYVNNTVVESIRCAKNGNIKNNLVIPYMWQKYHNGTTLLTEQDLNISVKVPYNVGINQLIIWGDSKNVSTDPLWSYLNTESGPIIQSVVQTINECATEHCSGHGRCESLTSQQCICDQGYSGTDCSKIL